MLVDLPYHGVVAFHGSNCFSTVRIFHTTLFSSPSHVRRNKANIAHGHDHVAGCLPGFPFLPVSSVSLPSAPLSRLSSYQTHFSSIVYVIKNVSSSQWSFASARLAASLSLGKHIRHRQNSLPKTAIDHVIASSTSDYTFNNRRLNLLLRKHHTSLIVHVCLN
jgi:hypothetical protein